MDWIAKRSSDSYSSRPNQSVVFGSMFMSMQFLRRLPPSTVTVIVTGASARRLSVPPIANVKPTTSENEVVEINKLMQNYNQNRTPIRTLALFEWMTNIIHVHPNFTSYVHLIQACAVVNHLETCRKLHRCIDQDQRLSRDDRQQLQIKLIYMYARMKRIADAKEIFDRIRTSESSLLFGTIFKAYNMNNQPKNTIALFEQQFMKKKTIPLEPVIATCVLSASRDCHRLDIGEYVHREIVRLGLLDGKPNIRLITALMDMYCACGSLTQARQIFDQNRSLVDHVAYSTLMKAYLFNQQPVEVLQLFDQCESSSISPDSLLYSYVIQACRQIGLPHQAEQLHRSIPAELIERNPQLQVQLIDLHSHSGQLAEARRLFHLTGANDAAALTSLLHGLAIHDHGQEALQLFESMKNDINYNANVYRAILQTCALTGGLVDQAKRIYQEIPVQHQTPDVAASLVSVLAGAARIDQAEAFVENYPHNPTLLWLNYFLVCYHTKDTERATKISSKLLHSPLVQLLYADLTKTVPSRDVLDHFRKKGPGVSWTEMIDDVQHRWIVHQFHDDLPMTSSNPKDFFCGHRATQLALDHHLQSSPSNQPIHLSKSKATCPICHDQMKQWSQTHRRSIVLKDAHRSHHFHQGQCSCHELFL